MNAKILPVHNAFPRQKAKTAWYFGDDEENRDGIQSNRDTSPEEL